MQYTDEGVPYFVDHNTQRTTWHDPRRDGADPVYATALRKRKPYASTPLLPLLSMCELTDSLSLSLARSGVAGPRARRRRRMRVRRRGGRRG
jgi:hypothetical protein